MISSVFFRGGTRSSPFLLVKLQHFYYFSTQIIVNGLNPPPVVAKNITVTNTVGLIDESGSVDSLVGLETTALAISDDEARWAAMVSHPYYLHVLRRNIIFKLKTGK